MPKWQPCAIAAIRGQRRAEADLNLPLHLLADPGVSTFRRPTLTELTEHHDILAEEDDPELSLVELLAVRITLHVEILDNEAASAEKSGEWSREQRGAELARDDAARCLALIARRQPGALDDERINDLLGDAIVKAAREADPSDPEFVAEYTDECGQAASRIMRAIATRLEVERRPPS